MNLNLQDNNGTTALMCGSAHGHANVVELLIKTNVNLNLQDNNCFLFLVIRLNYYIIS